MSHGPTLSFEPEVKLPNQPFFSWVRGETTLYISQVLGLITFISAIAGMIYYVTRSAGKEPEVDISPENIQAVVHYAHIIFITIFIVVLLSILDRNDAGEHRIVMVYERVFNKIQCEERSKELIALGKDHLRYFKLNFLWFWIFTLCLYIALAIQLNIPPKSDTGIVDLFKFICFAFNTLGLWAIYQCFIVLSMPETDLYKKMRWIGRAIVCLALVIFLSIVIFNTFFIHSYLHISDDSFESAATFLDALSGTLYAVVLAVFIARMDSKLIGLPSWLICLLYFYSAIQPLYVAFAQHGPPYEDIKTTVFILAFIFKIYFFLIVAYTMQTGRLLNYLYCFPELSDRVERHKGGFPSSAGFFEWLRDKISDKVPALLAFVFVVIALCVLVRGNDANDQTWIHVVHIPILLLLVILAFSNRKKYKPGGRELDALVGMRRKIYDLGRNSTRFWDSSVLELSKFERYFSWVWISLLGFYIAMVIIPFAKPPLNYPIPLGEGVQYLALNFITFGCDVLSTLFLFRCFTIMYMPAHDVESRVKQGTLWRQAIFAFVIICASYWVAVFYTCTLDNLKEENIIQLTTRFEALDDTLTAVVIALLVARLDSKLIGLPSLLIGMVYFYSAVQPLFIVGWGDSQPFKDLTTVLYVFVLLLKMLLFLVVAYILQTGRLLHYLFNYPVLEWRVDSVFANQFEIKVLKDGHGNHPFTFQITNHSKLVYISDHGYHDRESCRTGVALLRQAVKAEAVKYIIKDSCGTYWVEARKKKTDQPAINRQTEFEDVIGAELLFFSNNLKSRKEAEALIKESQNKLPHCKTDFV